MKMRAYYNDNGEIYTILMGGLGEPALLVKHSHPDGLDFIVTGYLGESSWHNADYILELEVALKMYDRLVKRGGSWD